LIAGVDYDDPDDYDDPNEIKMTIMMKNTTTTKKRKLRINLNNSNKLTLKRSKTSLEMQDKTLIQTCINQTITPTRNNWTTQ
jgi:hypothetical protein